MRWLLFVSGCAGQAVALVWLYRAGWFSGAPSRRRCGPLLLLTAGVVAVLLFAIWERHFVLVLGQAAATVLCLLGRPLSAGSASGRRHTSWP